MGRGTLGRRLVLQVVALVALVAVLLSALTTLAVHQLMIGQLDQQVAGAANRVSGGGPVGPDDGANGPRQQVGTLIVAEQSGDSGGVVLGESSTSSRKLSADVVQRVLTASKGETKLTLSLPGYGRYRLAVRQYGELTVVAGLPTTQVDRVLAGLIGLELILAALATFGAALGARALVRQSLRPLNRLASTATQVSRLELDRGEVTLPVRVADADADPRSEVGRVGQAFNHMLSNVDGALAVRQRSESKLRQFVADASHELRNPLAAIRGYSELTRRTRADLGADTAFAMARVESEAERMSRLVEDLLLLARLDSGPNLDLSDTDLSEIVVNATSDARAAGPDHVWTIAIPDEPVIVRADRHRVHQVVANLLANARAHTPGGTRVEAGLRIEQRDPGADGGVDGGVDGRQEKAAAKPVAVVSVTDNGPGIPAAIAGEVFERFTRADTSRARSEGGAEGGSTGLGLAIVAAVVEAHHGAVWVDSRPGRTTFSVALPLVGHGSDTAAAARVDRRATLPTLTSETG